MVKEASIYDVPVIGPWTAKVGHVIDIVSTPCEVEPQIAVYAFWHNLPYLVWSLTKPDTNDLVTRRFAGKHGRRPRKRFGLDGLLMPITAPKSGLGWVFFKLGSLAERLGWYMLVVDATTDFVVNWTSTAYQWQGCQAPGSPYAKSFAFEGPTIPVPAGTYIYDQWIVQHQHIFTADQESIAVPAGYDTSVSVAWRSEDPGPPFSYGPVTGVQLVDVFSDTVLGDWQASEGLAGSTFVNEVWKDWSLTPPLRVYAVRITKEEGVYKPVDCLFSCYGNKHRGILSDP